ncbi:MAG: xanthine dehydrogenase family protein subunit M, partial [Solirubrobacteraceae bacterium]
AGVGYVSLAVGGDAKAIVRSAAWVRANGAIEDARVVLAVVGPCPIRHAGMEERLRGSAVTADALAAAAEAIGDDIEPVGDAHASGEYRRAMARVVARRAVAEAIERGAA